MGFHLSPGQKSDLDGADALLGELLDEIQIGALIADKGYDADERVLDRLKEAAVEAVIPPKANRRERRECDKHLYKRRHLIENFFRKLKRYRGIATRYDKRGAIFLGAIYLAATVIWLI